MTAEAEHPGGPLAVAPIGPGRGRKWGRCGPAAGPWLEIRLAGGNAAQGQESGVERADPLARSALGGIQGLPFWHYGATPAPRPDPGLLYRHTSYSRKATANRVDAAPIQVHTSNVPGNDQRTGNNAVKNNCRLTTVQVREYQEILADQFGSAKTDSIGIDRIRHTAFLPNFDTPVLTVEFVREQQTDFWILDYATSGAIAEQFEKQFRG